MDTTICMHENMPFRSKKILSSGKLLFYLFSDEGKDFRDKIYNVHSVKYMNNRSFACVNSYKSSLPVE